jgi:hypothetical protein
MGHSRAVALTGSDFQAAASPAIFRGFYALETGGAAAATIRIYNGTSVSGVLVGGANLVASASADTEYADLFCEGGIFVDVGGTGVLAGSVRIG